MTRLDDLAIPDIRLKKPMPRVLEKKLQRAQVEKHRQLIKAEVFERDHGRCRCCGGYAFELHELRFRSLGGERSRHNSIAVCNFKGNHCHQLLQRLVILYEFVDTERGADQPIKFSTGSKMWFG